jgi:transposase
MASSRQYPPKLREQAVRMIVEITDQYESERTVMRKVLRLLRVGTTETVRKRVRQGLGRFLGSPPG